MILRVVSHTFATVFVELFQYVARDPVGRKADAKLRTTVPAPLTTYRALLGFSRLSYALVHH